MGQNGTNSVKMSPNGSKWVKQSNMVEKCHLKKKPQSYPKRPEMIQTGQKWLKNFQTCLMLTKLVQSGAICTKKV